MSENISPNPCYSLWFKQELGFDSPLESFSSFCDACDFAAKHFAMLYGLKGDNFYLHWDIILKDKNCARIWQSKEGDYRIVQDRSWG